MSGLCVYDGCLGTYMEGLFVSMVNLQVCWLCVQVDIMENGGEACLW